ncbi:MAG: heme exporter protein [Desulfovibrionales bacterium]|jgi:heme exporter protein A|nr:heme exporter protein [Desulfovibrionales bacterium]
MSRTILALSRVGKAFGLRAVLKDVSLELAPGEILLAAGPNGAGKSTLLRIMAGLSRPTTGSCETDLEPEQIGYLGHETFVYPRLTALQNLAFWARMQGLAPTEAELEERLSEVGLAGFSRERAHVFSRGMVQRLALARVFAPDPKLLFLDEPSTGLDAQSTAMLHERIVRAAKGGASVVWVSHDVSRDALLATRLLALERGRVVHLGDPEVWLKERAVC